MYYLLAGYVSEDPIGMKILASSDDPKFLRNEMIESAYEDINNNFSEKLFGFDEFLEWIAEGLTNIDIENNASHMELTFENGSTISIPLHNRNFTESESLNIEISPITINSFYVNANGRQYRAASKIVEF